MKKFLTFVFTFLSLFILVGQEKGFSPLDEREALSQVEKLKRLNPSFNNISPQFVNSFWSIRADAKSSRDGSKWQNISPIGMTGIGNDFVASGRVRYIDYVKKGLVRVASASGGLWEVREDNGSYSYKNLSKDKVSSPWAGVVGTSPYNEKLILYGTGEPVFNHGGGLWKTLDGGEKWINVSLPGESNNFVDISFTNIKKKVWLLGESGLYLSLDDGTSWKRRKSGYFSGMAVNEKSPDTLMIAEYGIGIFRSFNGGINWTKLSNGLPSESEFERIRLSSCKSSPNVIYAMYTTKSNTTLGIYKTIDGGNNWTRCRIFDANGKENPEFHWGMAWYCSYISVSPTNPDHVTAGGGWYVVSTNGQDFDGPEAAQHPDFHCGTWSKDGSEFFVGNDGGIYSAKFDGKFDWNYEYNKLPITQYISFATSKVEPTIMVGGSQDNGLSNFEINSKKWIILGGDGGGVSTHPYDKKYMFGTLGLFGNGPTFRNMRRSKLNAGSWENSNLGIPNTQQWNRLVETDYNDPPKIISHGFNSLYYSDNYGDLWLPLDFGNLDIPEIYSIGINNKENYNIYVTGPSDTSAIYRMSFEDYSLVNITHDLPAKYGETSPQVYVPSTAAFADYVYVVMRGSSNLLKGKVIYRSSNKGDNWENITGNLPFVPFTTLLVHPRNQDVIIAGTDGFGLYKTVDGGNYWKAWDDDIVKGANFTDMDYQIGKNDSIFAVIATYGSGTYRRYLDDNLSVNTNDYDQIKIFNYFCNDGILTINLSTQLSSGDILMLHDAMGKNMLKINDFEPFYSNDKSALKIDLSHLGNALYFGSLRKSNGATETIKIFNK